MKFNTKNLLENKFVLYLVFFLALVSVFSYIVSNNYAPVLLFLLISILTYYFSKNMIIILGAAIVGTHIVSLVNGTNIFNGGNREGFVEGANDDISGNNTAAGSTSTAAAGSTSTAAAGSTSTAAGSTSTAAGSTSTAADGTPTAADGTPTAADGTPTADNKAVTGVKVTGDEVTSNEQFTNQSLTPAALNLPNVDNLAAKDDKAKRTERAYDILESGLGGGGDTKDLLNKQVQLMDQMKQITPILQQTMGLVNNIDLGSLTDMADKITKMIPQDLGSISDLANKASASAKN